MIRIGASVVLALLASGSQAAPPSGPPAFSKKPSVARHGQEVRIEFAVDRQTDVAVYVENANGDTVRHLAAGALGKNPPDPLKAGSLAQSLVWDGRDDDGNVAAGGPFKVRVGLGLRARYGGTAFSDHSGPHQLTNVEGLAAGRDGRVYVMDNRSGWLYAPSYGLHAFRRDGSYERTLKPFPSHLPPDRLKAAGAFTNDRGLLNPILHRVLSMSFYPYEDEPAAQMAVTPGGHILLAVVPTQSGGRTDMPGTEAHLAALDADGGIPGDRYAGPPLGKGLAYRGEARAGGARMAVSPDGKYAYLVNVGHRYYDKKFLFKKHPVVYRVPLPAMGPAEIFFGEKDVAGNDGGHLSDPSGVAVDGKGRLFVADSGNGRVVVLEERDGRFAGSFPVPAPQWVAVHPRTGAVYVHSGSRLVKFSGWEDAKETAALDLTRMYGPSRPGRPAPRLSFALDASAEPPVVWVGASSGESPLRRCEDRGDGFSELEPARTFANPRQWRPASDPTHRRVSCRIDDPGGGSTLHVIDEASGQTRKVKVQAGLGSNQGTTSRLDREGNIYSCAAAGGIWKCDPSGKRVPFPATADDPALKGHLPAGSTGTTAWERDWYVDRKGNIYAKVRGTRYHGLMRVEVFGPDGARKRVALWGVSDGSYGPRVDPRGNLYMMECVKPVGRPFPDELAPYVVDKGVRHWYDWIYGSVVKFGPQGGNLWLKTRDAGKNSPGGDPVKLPEGTKREKVCSSLRGDDNEMEGALWMAPGVAHCGDMGVAGGGEHCHCTACDFDVDDFGRSFAPDNGRQRISVFDANGNAILHFGGYGNQDYCGPDSYVLDPEGKFFRPRRAEDPPGLKSPFAEPDIGLNFVIGLAVTDRHAYVLDCTNRRMLRVRLDYAAVETAAVP
jgi:hypothetical protein